MLARLEQHRSPLTKTEARRARHLLVILPNAGKSTALRGVPYADALEAALERRKKKLEDLRKSPIATELPHGALVSWVVDDGERPVFERQTTLRKALQALLAEHPREIAIALSG